LVDVVHDHEAEGEGVEDVEELVGGEVFVGGEVQLGDEDILEEGAVFVAVVEAKGGSQREEEASELIKADEGGGIWVVLLPGVAELLIHVNIEQTSILGLHVIVPL